MIITLDNFNLQPNNTFRMNVTCRNWTEFTSPEDLPAIFSTLGSAPWKCVGACSNILFTADYSGTLLHSAIMDMTMETANDGSVIVRAGSGIEMDALIAQTASAGLWGLENLSGIPGEVGAAAVQNVGAYGVEAKDAIVRVECFDTKERCMVTFGVEECNYGYRTSRFKTVPDKGRYVITHVTFRLSSSPAPVLDYGHVKSRLKEDQAITPLVMRETIMAMRSEKLPEVDKVGSAGSYFKNPVLDNASFDNLLRRCEEEQLANPPFFEVNEGIKVPAAWLIDKSGLKGVAKGEASTWQQQPLVIVNTRGKAAPADIIALEHHIIDTVQQKFGVTLVPEVEKV